MRKRIFTKEERSEILRITASIKSYPTKQKMRELVYKTMPVIDYVLDIIYRRGRSAMYEKIFMRILTHAKRYDPMTYTEAVEYWDDVVLKMPEDEMRSQALVFLWRALDGFVAYHPHMSRMRKYALEDYLIGGVIYRLRNYIRDRETYRQRVRLLEETDTELYYEYAPDESMYDYNWVVSGDFNCSFNFKGISPYERYVAKLIMDGYNSVEIRRRLGLNLKEYNEILQKIKGVMDA